MSVTLDDDLFMYILERAINDAHTGWAEYASYPDDEDVALLGEAVALVNDDKIRGAFEHDWNTLRIMCESHMVKQSRGESQ